MVLTGVILWYRVLFEGPTPAPSDGWLRLSNDVYGGDYLADAEIAVEAREGASAPTFSLRFVNLPEHVGKRIDAAQSDGIRARRPLTAAVHLGYYEKLPGIFSRAVLRGVVTRCSSRWEDDGTLRTEVSGQEIAAWKLLQLKNVDFALAEGTTWEAAIRDLLGRVEGGLEAVGRIPSGRAGRNRVLRAPNALSALGALARMAGTRFALRDGVVRFPSVLPPDIGPLLDVEENIISLDEAMEIERPRPRTEAGANDRPDTRPRKVYKLKVLGEAGLRVGQTVPVRAKDAPITLHVVSVRHTYGLRGFVSDVELDLSEEGEAPRPNGAARIVDRFRELTANDSRPGIEVGEVASYESGAQGLHLATVYYGQRADADTVAPSVETAVERRDDQQFRQRPIASPFAWHRCGLVVPAYPGQRTLLSHNRGDVNDVVLHGYVWAEQPLMERPQNEPGDWWLCLPTEVRDGRPSGRGANDLTDARGLRVIQAGGLTIQVGPDRLPELGARPTPPDADTLTIEHARGTTISISSDGAVEIRTDGRAITLTDGSVRLALSGGAVEVS